MIPILYRGSEEEFKSNGIGRLTDCISCIVTEQRNGIYECEFQYPVAGSHYADIKEGCIICATHDDTQTVQPFDIYKRSAPLNGVVTFNACHISYRLSRIVLQPFTADSCASALAQLKGKSLNECPFTFWTDKDVNGEYSVTVPVSIKEMLGGTQNSVLDVYGTGEYEWDFWTVKLHLHRGERKAVQIRYGRDMTDVTHERDTGECYNAVVPYWVSGEGGEAVTLPEGLILGSETITTAEPWWQETRELMTDENGTTLEFSVSTINAVSMDLSQYWTEAPSEEELRAKAQELLENSKPWLPNENIKVDFVQAWQTPEYENVAPLQRVRLCDTVAVLYPELGVDASMQIVRTDYNTLLDRYDSMELGSPSVSFADVVKADTETTLLRNVPTRNYMQQAIDSASSLITGGLGGHIVIGKDADGRPNEILIMDTDSAATAVNVIRINANGIGFSTTGYNGPFRTAWTIDGSFVADFITAGTLQANLIRGGVLSSDDGMSYWNIGGDGAFVVYSPGMEGRIRISNGLIRFYRNSYQNGSIPVARIGQMGSLIGDTNADVIGISTRTEIIFGYTNASDRNIAVLGISAEAPYLRIYRPTIRYRNVEIIQGTGADNSNILRIKADHFTVDSTGSMAYMTSYVFYAESAYIVNTISATTVTQRSDERDKDIKNWDDRYTALLDDLEPIRYIWHSDEEQREYIGLGAQRTEKALKDHGLENSGFVHHDEKDDVYGISYSDLTVMLLKKVQEQDQVIKELRRRIEALEGGQHADT